MQPLSIITNNGIEQQKQLYLKRSQKLNMLFADYELARNRAAFIRWKSIESLDKHLIQFEANCIKAGIKIHWAPDIFSATTEINSILDKSNSCSVLLENNSVAGEISLYEHLCAKKSTTLFLKNDTSSDNVSNKNFDAHIVHSTFLAADAGAIVLDNNDDISFNNCKNTIVLAPIDCLIPFLSDVELLLSLQAAHTTDGGIIKALKIISGAEQTNSGNVNTIYVVLIDNGRSQLMESLQQRQTLHCIQCGACNAFCPVVASVDLPEINPLAFVSSPLGKEKKSDIHPSYSSPLCGRCNDVCPVKIDFKKIMLRSREQLVLEKFSSQQEKLFYFFWKKTMLKREFLNWNTLNSHRKVVETLFLRSKTGKRKLPAPAPKSFNQQWRERLGMK